jgi:hypothetical protein
MKVLGIDVGIVNLAYCIIEFIDDKFTVVEWDLINLVPDRIQCDHIKKKFLKCDNIASIHNKFTNKYYCSTHSNKNNIDIHDVECKLLISNKNKNKNENENENEYKLVISNDSPVYKHLSSVVNIENLKVEKNTNTYILSCREAKKLLKKGYITCEVPKCNNHIDKCVINENNIDSIKLWCSKCCSSELNKFIKCKTFNFSQDASKFPVYELALSFFKQADKMKHLLDVDAVYIENQPTFIHPTMKTISSVLMSYFLMRGIHEKSTTNSLIKIVKFTSPSKKISIRDNTNDFNLENKINKTKKTSDKKKIYKITKDIAVEMVKGLLDKLGKTDELKMITTHDKQDDLADAFLHAFVTYYGSDIPDEYSKIVNEMTIPKKNIVNKEKKVKKEKKVNKEKKVKKTNESDTNVTNESDTNVIDKSNLDPINDDIINNENNENNENKIIKKSKSKSKFK